MPKVGIVMGSDSDLKVMSKAADMLEKLGIDYEIPVCRSFSLRCHHYDHCHNRC